MSDYGKDFQVKDWPEKGPMDSHVERLLQLARAMVEDGHSKGKEAVREYTDIGVLVQAAALYLVHEDTAGSWAQIMSFLQYACYLDREEKMQGSAQRAFGRIGLAELETYKDNLVPLQILQMWEGEGSGSRFDYGAMGTIDLRMKLRGKELFVSFSYVDMDMEPLNIMVRDGDQLIAFHEWYRDEEGMLQDPPRLSDHEIVEQLRENLNSLSDGEMDRMKYVLGDELIKSVVGGNEDG